MSCIRAIGIPRVADAVDDGLEIRPTCSTKGCGAPAGKRSGRCARCYWKRWYSANRVKLLAERRSARHTASGIHGPRVSARFIAMQLLKPDRLRKCADSNLEWRSNEIAVRLSGIIKGIRRNSRPRPRGGPAPSGYNSALQKPGTCRRSTERMEESRKT
jgi:hypothetical protein